MNNMELETDIEALEMEMGDVTIHYCPVIPNPEGEPTAELKTADIEGTIYEIVDEEARTELENKVDKVEGKDLSTNDYTDEDKTIVDGVTEALNGKVDKDGDKVLSDNNYSDEDKAIVDGVTEALNGKADKSDTYTKSEVDSALENKVNRDGDKVLSDNNYSDTDKTKLDGIEAEANKTVVDTEISATSTNPLQNKAIYDLLNDLLPEGEATGNPIAISNASGFNAKALTVDMLPIQDLHGYDKPWSGGSGKNKFNVREFINNSPVKQRCTVSVADDDTVTVTSTETGGSWIGFAVNVGGTLPTNTFTIPANVGDKFVPSGTSVMFYEIDENDIILSLTQCNIGSYYTVTNNNCKKLAFRLIFGSMSQGESVSFKEQIEKGETATSYEPYSNICPISGRSSLDVTVNGLNIWDEQWEVGAIDSSTGQNTQGTAGIRTKNYIEVTPNITYFCYIGGLTGYNLKPRWYDKDKNYLGYSPSVPYGGTFTVPSNAHYLRFCPQDTYGTTYKNDICINISNSSVNGTYEPYTEADTTVQFGQTVYGGTSDVVNGGTSDKYGKKLCTISQRNSSTAIGTTITRHNFYLSSLDINVDVNNRTKSICNITNYVADFSGEFVHFMINTAGTQLYLFMPNDTPLSTEFEICYPLATPTTLSTPATTISLNKGNNTLSTSGDNMDLKYSKTPQ